MLIDVVVVVLTFIYSSPHNAAPPVVTGGKQKIGKTHTPNTYVYVYISKSNNEINKQQFRIPDTGTKYTPEKKKKKTARVASVCVHVLHISTRRHPALQPSVPVLLSY